MYKFVQLTMNGNTLDATIYDSPFLFCGLLSIRSIDDAGLENPSPIIIHAYPAIAMNSAAEGELCIRRKATRIASGPVA